MRHILLSSTILIFLFAFVLGACDSSNTPEAESSTPPMSIQLETPPSSPDDAYPPPASLEDFTISEIPTPSADMAIITGVLLQQLENAPEPATQRLLGLGNIIPSSTGEPVVASFNPGSSPRTFTDSTGRFVFVDVPPGQYALIFDRITDSFLLNDPKTGGDFLFFAEADQTLDLGELLYDSLPDSGDE